jgi:hypothetical protein
MTVSAFTPGRPWYTMSTGTGTVLARIISTPMMVNISKSTQPILMRFAAYERKFSWPHFLITIIIVVAEYHDYVIYRAKNL